MELGKILVLLFKTHTKLLSSFYLFISVISSRIKITNCTILLVRKVSYNKQCFRINCVMLCELIMLRTLINSVVPIYRQCCNLISILLINNYNYHSFKFEYCVTLNRYSTWPYSVHHRRQIWHIFHLFDIAVWSLSIYLFLKSFNPVRSYGMTKEFHRIFVYHHDRSCWCLILSKSTHRFIFYFSRNPCNILRKWLKRLMRFQSQGLRYVAVE